MDPFQQWSHSKGRLGTLIMLIYMVAVPFIVLAYYDAIPSDYDGVMGVPITFLYKYNPKQFEILDLINRYMIFDYFGVNEEVRKKHSHCANVNGKSTYARILIKKIQQG